MQGHRRLLIHSFQQARGLSEGFVSGRLAADSKPESAKFKIRYLRTVKIQTRRSHQLSFISLWSLRNGFFPKAVDLLAHRFLCPASSPLQMELTVKALLLFCFLFFSPALSLLHCAGSNSSTVDSISKGEKMKISGECLPGPAAAHRGLLGPGSSPPRCTHKCGRCRPCLAVHVPVPPAGTPGIPATDEYYPEAWRCKCGNRLFKP
ncbi:Epidermal patterning factor-like protein 6 [Apostasia shenzhenica]|uniref:Epidermal patterning factor-like protein n=1 Tax=Apostasia shenzhenica TaxID=1088818 RepID=A0A2I0BHF9_9ASPA|nr:Epidermal patterning factor-like protein 6 [Apostasia shenzhenica]